MSDLEFARTPMGRAFYDRTMPRIADQLERLTTTIDSLAKALLLLRGEPLGSIAPTIAEPATDAPAGGPAAPGALLACVLEDLAAGYAQVLAPTPTSSDTATAAPLTATALEAALRAAFRMGVAAGSAFRRPDGSASGPVAAATGA